MRVLRLLLKSIKKLLLGLGRCIGYSRKVIVVAGSTERELISDVSQRINFYAANPALEIKVVSKIPYFEAFLGAQTLNFSSYKQGRSSRLLSRLLPATYQVDHRVGVAGWEWIRFSNAVSCHLVDREKAYKNFKTAMRNNKKYSKAYIFGTGPSLARAIERDWSDGAKIVCNTIVRDRNLINHIKPQFVVAGDAVYHFSHTEFAKNFRRDLFNRMGEHEQLYFVYPDIFDVIVQRELAQFSSRLVPIPTGTERRVDINLIHSFNLPGLGNVLALLLLPLALTISNRVYLTGFDGRDPQDRASPFWANSALHSYPELMWTLKDQFPGFFNHFVPENDSTHYIKSVHEDLEPILVDAEYRGAEFEMLHPSWTETLNRRYKGNLTPQEYYYGHG
jgi:hypothetical protein